MPSDQNIHPPAPAAPSEPGSAKVDPEVAFLRGEKSRAEAAISAALDELTTSLGTAADVRLWTRQHPWAGTAAAAAAGFAAAVIVLPNKRKQDGSGDTSNRSPYGGPAESATPTSQAPVAAHPTLLRELISGVFGLARVAVGQWIAATMTRRPPDPATATDGQPVAPSESP